MAALPNPYLLDDRSLALLPDCSYCKDKGSTFCGSDHKCCANGYGCVAVSQINGINGPVREPLCVKLDKPHQPLRNATTNTICITTKIEHISDSVSSGTIPPLPTSCNEKSRAPDSPHAQWMMSTEATVVILLGGIVMVIGLLVVIFCCGRSRGRKEEGGAAEKALEIGGVLHVELAAHPHYEASENGMVRGCSQGDSGQLQVFYELSTKQSIRQATSRPSTPLAIGNIAETGGR